MLTPRLVATYSALRVVAGVLIMPLPCHILINQGMSNESWANILSKALILATSLLSTNGFELLLIDEMNVT